ncbi:MAG TPA: gamma-glutamyl-gamma-aminobutyrate hydrolase family protein [Solirubrobacterales bacterium]|jgi:putative glutamine amidotransferase|nr:gamma-glutamyl-gamma-aminobutyrate hydrolase family protein [Solirubrobacterales bacterium]
MASPVVGISAALERARWGVWEETVTLAPRSYATAVQRAGGTAVLLPPDAAAEADPDRMLELLDALILAGGADIDAGTYGAEPHPETKNTWPERDSFEVALARRALDRDMPLLGICRGMQILNVARGGTLCQHLPDVIGHERHREVAGTFGDHEVRLEPGSLAAEAAGAERVGVKSHHHQGVDEVGKGLVVSGHSVDDELIEAIELPERRFALGVIWHPEEDVDDRVIGALVGAARGGGRSSFRKVKGGATTS